MPRFALRRISMAAPLALLVGCSGVSAVWVKPGVSEAQVKADNAVCRAEAEDVHGRTADITHDIQVSRPRSQTNVDERSDDIRSFRTERSYDRIFDGCMAARGYSRRDKDR